MFNDIVSERSRIVSAEIKLILEEKESALRKVEELEVRLHQLVGALEELRLLEETLGEKR